MASVSMNIITWRGLLATTRHGLPVCPLCRLSAASSIVRSIFVRPIGQTAEARRIVGWGRRLSFLSQRCHHDAEGTTIKTENVTCPPSFPPLTALLVPRTGYGAINGTASDMETMAY
jgi:hypothetical protein